MGVNWNRVSHPIAASRPDVVIVYLRLAGAGAAALTDRDAGQLGSVVSGIVRDGAGLYTVTIREKFKGEIQHLSRPSVKAGTAGHITDYSAEDLANGTLTIRNVDAAAAAADIANGAHVYVEIHVRTKTRN